MQKSYVSSTSRGIVSTMFFSSLSVGQGALWVVGMVSRVSLAVLKTSRATSHTDWEGVLTRDTIRLSNCSANSFDLRRISGKFLQF